LYLPLLLAAFVCACSPPHQSAVDEEVGINSSDDTETRTDSVTVRWSTQPECVETGVDENRLIGSHAIPSGDAGVSEGLTEREVRAFAGNELEGSSTLIRAHESLSPSPDWPYALHRGDDESIRLFYHYVTGEVGESNPAEEVVTVLVNYRPVEVKYVVWNADRTVAKIDKTATGISREKTEPITLLDIEIAAAEVEGVEHPFEVSVGYSAREASGTERVNYDRFAVFSEKQDLEPVSAPCVEPSSSSSLTRFEETMVDAGFNTYRHDTMAYDEGTTAERVLDGSIELDTAGRAQIVVANYSRESVASTVAIVPTLDGRPVAPVRYVLRPANPQVGPSTIDFRDTLDIDVPEAHASHDLVVMTWTNPFVAAVDSEGDRVRGVKYGDLVGFSNWLTLGSK
jgi:hypothetical protein